MYATRSAWQHGRSLLGSISHHIFQSFLGEVFLFLSLYGFWHHHGLRLVWSIILPPRSIEKQSINTATPPRTPSSINRHFCPIPSLSSKISLAALARDTTPTTPSVHSRSKLVLSSLRFLLSHCPRIGFYTSMLLTPKATCLYPHLHLHHYLSLHGWIDGSLILLSFCGTSLSSIPSKPGDDLGGGKWPPACFLSPIRWRIELPSDRYRPASPAGTICLISVSLSSFLFRIITA